jgi:hypothetical protein
MCETAYSVFSKLLSIHAGHFSTATYLKAWQHGTQLTGTVFISVAVNAPPYVKLRGWISEFISQHFKNHEEYDLWGYTGM